VVVKDSTVVVMSEATAAETLGLSARTLERWRVEGRGPAFIKLGKSVRYRPVDLAEFIERQRRTSTSEVGR
jgi:predicted site-specific integrase-resolvase